MVIMVLVVVSLMAVSVGAETNLIKFKRVGNFSFISLDIIGIPADHAQEILEVLYAFEKLNPGQEILSWSIEKDQLTPITKPYIYGIWINHRKK